MSATDLFISKTPPKYAVELNYVPTQPKPFIVRLLDPTSIMCLKLDLPLSIAMAVAGEPKPYDGEGATIEEAFNDALAKYESGGPISLSPEGVEAVARFKESNPVSLSAEVAHMMREAGFVADDDPPADEAQPEAEGAANV